MKLGKRGYQVFKKTHRAERENRRSLGIFQEPVEEIIWV